MTKTIGVFGAKGFIGRHIVRRLASVGRPVIAFGRHFPADYQTTIGFPVETRDIDFGDVVGTQAKMQDVSIVVQLINSSSPSLGNVHLSADFKSNVAPHIKFIESCAFSGIKKFLFLSSGGTVYGNPDYLPIDEKHPTRPINSYGLTKLVIENYLRLISSQSEMDYINLRVSNPFGPGQSVNKGQGLIPAILQKTLKAQPVIIYGDGSVQRDYIYIDDAIDAIIAAIEAEGLSDTLNVGSGIGRSIVDVLSTIEVVLQTPVLAEFSEGRTTDAHSNVLDASRARRLLNWSPKWAFLDGIKATISQGGATNRR
jgi:UDP-glucose 4-epimerase